MAVIAAFGIALCWPLAFLGVWARTPEAVNTFGFMLILPLTFMSSTFHTGHIDARMAPGDRQGESDHVRRRHDARTDAGRARRRAVHEAFISLVVVVVVFAPLAIARYRRRI